MTNTKVMPLYEQVAMRVQQQIEDGKFGVDEQIYSIREMCEAFGVAEVTAKKAIKLLLDRGVVHTVPGRGTFASHPDRSDGPSTASRMVGFLKAGAQPAPIFAHEIDVVQRRLQSAGFPMLYAAADDEEHMNSALTQMQEVGVKCLLVFPRHGGRGEEDWFYMPLLRKCGIPLLVIESRSEQNSYVAADVARSVRILGDYLHDLGHNRICLASAYSPKREGFAAMLKTWPESARAQTSEAIPAGDSETDAVSLADKILAMSPRPTAVIADRDEMAGIMVSRFQAAGLNVPDDISVATTDDHPQLRQRSPVPLTAMQHPADMIAGEVCDWVQKRMTGTDPRGRRLQRLITGSLIVRQSTAPPKK